MGIAGEGRLRDDKMAPRTEKWSRTLSSDRRPTEGTRDDDVERSPTQGLGPDLLRPPMSDRHPQAHADKSDRTFKVVNPPGAGLKENALDLRQRRGDHQARKPATAPEIQEAAGERVEVTKDADEPGGVTEVILYGPGTEKAELPAPLEGRDQGSSGGSLDQLSSPSAG